MENEQIIIELLNGLIAGVDSLKTVTDYKINCVEKEVGELNRRINKSMTIVEDVKTLNGNVNFIRDRVNDTYLIFRDDYQKRENIRDWIKSMLQAFCWLIVILSISFTLVSVLLGVFK